MLLTYFDWLNFPCPFILIYYSSWEFKEIGKLFNLNFILNDNNVFESMYISFV